MSIATVRMIALLSVVVWVINGCAEAVARATSKYLLAIEAATRDHYASKGVL